MVTITHTYTLNMPTYKNTVDEKGLEDQKKTWLVGTMSRHPCMALSFHMCVNLCVYVSVVNWWCGISKVTCMFTCSGVFSFFFFLLMVDEVQSRIGKVRKDTKGQTENTKRTWEKCEVGRKWCSFTQNDCTANVPLFHMSLFAFLLFNIGWVTFFTSKLCWKQPWAYGQEHGCCADRLWVWAGWGWDMSLRDVRKRPCLWERVCGQSNWQNRITELVSKLKVIEWVRQTGHTTVGKQVSALSKGTKDWSVSAFTARKDVQSGELSLRRSLSLSSFVGVAMVTGKAFLSGP